MWPVPQGYPVLFQAGSSELGKELAARRGRSVHGALFGANARRNFAGTSRAGCRNTAARLKQLKVMPGLNAIVGRTEEEAKEKHAYLQSLIHPDVGLELLSNAVDGFDLRPFPLDGPLPEAVDATCKKGSSTALRTCCAGRARRS